MTPIDEAKSQFDKAIEHLATELNGIRTGRATPAILEPISVEAYGSMQPIKALASISVPDAKTLAIEPWDPTVVKAIEAAIMKSDIGIMPNTDGKVIRLSMPAMTDETRQKMVKIMKEKLEEGKVSVRRIREEVKKKIEKTDGGEDEQRNLQKKLDEVVKTLNTKIEEMGAKKEKEITTI